MARTLRLPRFPQSNSIVDDKGKPDPHFLRTIHNSFDAMEKVVASLNSANDALTNQIMMLTDTVRSTAIASSYTVPTACLTATDAGGGHATITIAVHTRYYGDNTAVGISAGAVTGLTYSTVYAVFYDDLTRRLNNPTFVATTNLKVAQNNALAGRHLVGTVTTPAAGGVATYGGTVPTGSGYSTGTGYTL